MDQFSDGTGSRLQIIVSSYSLLSRFLVALLPLGG